MTTKEVRRVLRGRHSMQGENGSAWVTLEECFNIDFLALACHSQGRSKARYDMDAVYPWIGYEIKVSRSDFLAELRRPYKRAFAVEITNEFYFATPAGLVKPEEIPVDCGLMYVWPTRTKIVKPSPITTAKELGRRHVTLMLRHGINPGWLRDLWFKREGMRRRERDAEEAIKAADREVQKARGILADRLGNTVVPGQIWSRPYSFATSGREQYEVLEVTDRTVKLGEHPARDRQFPFFPRVELGEFLLRYSFERPPPYQSVAMVASTKVGHRP